MNFNDNQFSPQIDSSNNNQYEDHDFYESLNYSKMTMQNTSNKKSRGQSPGLTQTQYSNNLANNNPWGKPASGMSQLSQKLSNLTSATMNTQANAIIKTVSLATNPYTDDLSKATKNINHPQSQQVSRAQSRVDMQDNDDDIEEIAQDITKKKVVKKKIIKRIIKRRNPDGTETLPQVTTYIVGGDGTKQ